MRVLCVVGMKKERSAKLLSFLHFYVDFLAEVRLSLMVLF